jgi:hypothetical protein
VFSEVDNEDHVFNGDAGLGNVGGQNHLPDAFWHLVEDSSLILPRQL